MAVKKNTLTELKKQLKDNNLKPVYLFWGEERYLTDNYADKLSDIIPDGGVPEFNRLVIEDAKTPLADILDFLETYPMMSEKKMLIMRDVGLFKSPGEEAKSFWVKQLENMPDYAVVLFIENEIDKRSVLYKTVDKIGLTVEFSYLSATDLTTWVERQFLQVKKKIKKENAQYLVEICDEGMGNLRNEVDKLINFCGEEVTHSDIERLVSKSLNVRVFEMTDAIISRHADTALKILSDMRTVKESAFKILYILFSTFDKLLHAQLLLKEGESAEMIAKKLKVPPFIARKYMQKSFDEDFLVTCVMNVAEIDFAVKEGRIDEWTALEQFVAEPFKV